MNIHLRFVDGKQEAVKDIVAKIRELTNGKAIIQDYASFISVEVNTDYESEYSAIFCERHYLKGDYCLCLYMRLDHNKEVIIPVDLIDTIFDL